MEAIQEERAPLYGRFDLTLLLHPFRPHEAAALLKGMSPSDQALVWGIVGGVPLYLEWWDARQTLKQNLLRLACSPGGRLLDEGQPCSQPRGIWATSAVWCYERSPRDARATTRSSRRSGQSRPGYWTGLSSCAWSNGCPVTENPARTRRRIYRIADNFLAFWLGVLDRHRSAIGRGLGKQILPVLNEQLNDHMGGRWESAFREHLIRLAASGDLGAEIVDIGRWWQDSPAAEIDAVALAGRSREAVLLGEAKWSPRANGQALRAGLEQKASLLPKVARSPTTSAAPASR